MLSSWRSKQTGRFDCVAVEDVMRGMFDVPASDRVRGDGRKIIGSLSFSLTCAPFSRIVTDAADKKMPIVCHVTFIFPVVHSNCKHDHAVAPGRATARTTLAGPRKHAEINITKGTQNLLCRA